VKTAGFWPRLFRHNSLKVDNRAVNWRSSSFKINDFCGNRKPIYDFLLVINCHLSSISHRFRDIASRSLKSPHPSLSHPIKGTAFEFRRQKLKVKTAVLSCENRVILPWVILSQYMHVRHKRQTTYHDNSRTIDIAIKLRRWAKNVPLFSNITLVFLDRFVIILYQEWMNKRRAVGLWLPWVVELVGNCRSGQMSVNCKDRAGIIKAENLSFAITDTRQAYQQWRSRLLFERSVCGCFGFSTLILQKMSQKSEAKIPEGDKIEDSSEKKLKPCCACPETKKARDQW